MMRQMTVDEFMVSLDGLMKDWTDDYIKQVGAEHMTGLQEQLLRSAFRAGCMVTMTHIAKTSAANMDSTE